MPGLVLTPKDLRGETWVSVFPTGIYYSGKIGGAISELFCYNRSGSQQLMALRSPLFTPGFKYYYNGYTPGIS